ncbi:MAG: hypothetical protein JWN48_3311 [Myxococcaceae bacterium]|nr:hypothetical protein [Myxococcaceae bacterium]
MRRFFAPARQRALRPSPRAALHWWWAALAVLLPSARGLAEDRPVNYAPVHSAPASYAPVDPAPAESVPVNYAPVAGAVSAPEPPLTLSPRSKAFTSGLGLGAGLGSDNVSLGGHLVYYVQLPNPRLHWAFHVGAGLVPAPDPQLRWGVRGGTFLSIGKRHRFLVGVIGGTMGWQTFGLHYERLAVEQVFGVGLSLGYELMTDRGLYLRVSVGPALAISSKLPFREREVDLVWRGNLISLGYKLW